MNDFAKGLHRRLAVGPLSDASGRGLGVGLISYYVNLITVTCSFGAAEGPCNTN